MGGVRSVYQIVFHPCLRTLAIAILSLRLSCPSHRCPSHRCPSRRRSFPPTAAPLAALVVPAAFLLASRRWDDLNSEPKLERVNHP